MAYVNVSNVVAQIENGHLDGLPLVEIGLGVFKGTP